MKNADMPAMPCDEFSFINESGYRETIRGHEGMSKREMMAMNAPEAPKWFFRKWASDNGIEYGNIGDNVSDAESFYFAWRTHYADALLAELERTK